MAQHDVLREFLVALGFKVDESGLKRFQGSVEGVTKTAAALGAVVVAAATAVSAAAVKIASNLDNVYFASQRTKASVQNINALKYAAQQVGLSADTAMGSLNSLASFLRSSPGAAKWIEKLGVATKDAHGKDRDRAEMLMDVGDKLKEMPEYQAIHYGSFLGMDETFVLALREGKFDAFFAQYKAMSKDSNLKKASEDANKFMTSLRGLIEEFKLLGIQVQAALLGKAGEAMAKFKAWFDDNKPRIVKALTDISTILITIATEVIPIMVGALEVFVKLDEATDGWSTKVLALAAAFRVLGGVAAFKFLMAGGSLAKSIATRAFGVGAAAMLYSSDLNKGEEDNGNVQGTKAREVKAEAGDMVAWFTERGWAEHQAKGIVANLQHESALNHKAVGDNGKAYGLAQLHPNRQEDFKKVIGKDIRESTREEQLVFINYELTQGKEKKAGDALKATKTAGEAAQVVSRKYERPANTEAEATARAKTAEAMKFTVPKPVVAEAPKKNQVSEEQQRKWDADNGVAPQPAAPVVIPAPDAKPVNVPVVQPDPVKVSTVQPDPIKANVVQPEAVTVPVNQPAPVTIPVQDIKAAETAARTADTLKVAAANTQSMSNAGLGYSNTTNNSNTYNQGKDVVINQTTNINVEGGGGQETARNITGALSSVNSNLVRNLRGAMA